MFPHTAPQGPRYDANRRVNTLITAVRISSSIGCTRPLILREDTMGLGLLDGDHLGHPFRPVIDPVPGRHYR